MFNFKTNFNYIISLTLLFFGSLILALLISFNGFNESLHSTGFTSLSSMRFLLNSTLDASIQIFGKSVYVIPIVILSWSLSLFYNIGIKHIKLKLVLILTNLFLIPLLFSKYLDHSKGGILGSFLLNTLYYLESYFVFILIFSIVSLIFVSGLSIRRILLIIDILLFIIKSISMYAYITLQLLMSKIKSLFNKIKLSHKTSDNNNILNNNYDKNEIYKTKFSTQSSAIDESINLNTSEYEIQNEVSTEATGVKTYNSAQTNINHGTTQNALYENYQLSYGLLDLPKNKNTSTSTAEIKLTATKLENVIKEFGIEGKITNIQTGPVVTLFEITIPPGVKTSKLTGLETDISLRMKAFSVRIAIVPGKDVIGIEIPNSQRETVYLRKLLENSSFKDTQFALPINLGLDISGKAVIADLASMPHLLIAGTTGSGKSVAVNAMILSLLYHLSPEQCKMIMIDPKMLELSIYQDIPHLLTPVVTDPKKAIYALKWAVKEMENRYNLMSYLGVRNINSYNEKLKDTDYMDGVKNNLNQTSNQELDFSYMNYIVIIIDEMADLMLVAGKEIEGAVQRLAQMARAAGIHLITATQRPSVDVITGTIKANFPTRISFQVSSKIDSRTILGEQGAERLLGKGDMLYMMGVGRIKRVHGPFVNDMEVEKVVKALHSLGKPFYLEEVTTNFEDQVSHSKANDTNTDELYEEAIDLIKREGRISTSFLQRSFQIGYNRAARIVELLEKQGIVSKPNNSGKRDIYIK